MSHETASAKDAFIDLNRQPGDRIASTTCYMCACRCGILVHVKDGRVTYIEGNRDHPVNKGVICGKGAAGIQQHHSPARLKAPMKRVGPRGSGQFVTINWDEALATATEWLAEIRRTDPKKLAFFTGRDQSQALTGWWASQFGTPNFAAHGGFCSVNMAAAGLYTFGGSFWEFGEPDWEHTKYFMLFGVAEDHASNPLKIALGKLKEKGVKIVSVNPVRTGYNAIADEWIGIRPGTDGLFVAALIQELLRTQRIDLDSISRYANASWLVIRDPGAADDGLIVRDAHGVPLVAVVGRGNGRAAGAESDAGSPAVDAPGAHSAEDDEPCDTPSPANARGDVAYSLSSAKRASDAAPAGDPAQDSAPKARPYRLAGWMKWAADERPLLAGSFTLADGRAATPVFHVLAERMMDPAYAPDAVAPQIGIPAETIRRIAAELAATAFDNSVILDQPWTDANGVTHDKTIGRPVSMHAMRGISAHSNGFHTCRLIHILQILLGAIDCPGGYRYKPPFPKPAPPSVRPAGKPGKVKAGAPLGGAPLGFPLGPEDLLVAADGTPQRIDKAYSWEAPLAAHGLMHAVIGNAAAADPYPVDVLFLYMANMSWNSSMNVPATLAQLTARNDDGGYAIPKIIYADAYASEMVAYADLVLPDTTYLERWDCISLLDRPISDPDAASDAIRQPVVEPDRNVRAFQSVLIDLGARLRLPGFVDAVGQPKYPGGYADYIVNHERAPGIGPLAGWRGKGGDRFGKGPINPKQLERYIENGCFHRHELAPEQRWMKHCNRDYLDWAVTVGFIGHADPIVFQLYCEPLQRFRLAALGHGPVQPATEHRERVAKYFDPLPFWYPPLEEQAHKGGDYPLHAITQRPMHMYHSWGSQNAWLRQISAENRLYLEAGRGRALGLVDDDWVWVTSPTGRLKCQVRLMQGCNPDTVWTWNAIGKRKGAWGLADDAPESERGFLLNHLIAELLPAGDGGARTSNSDPVTGQAAWYDLRVRVEKCAISDAKEAYPKFEAIRPSPAI